MAPATKIEIRNLDFFYGSSHVIRSLDLNIREKRILSLIGPSGCGKTTLLRCLNRIFELYAGTRASGEIVLLPDEINVLSPKVTATTLRSRVAMIFQKPNPFPKSIFENVAYGLRVRGGLTPKEIEEKVERALRKSALWDEVKDRLSASALELSGGQAQRLCVARALALEPEVILFDEPTSALDPHATAKLEEMIMSLKKDTTIMMVTHNLQQAMRVSDDTAFMSMGELIEWNSTASLFSGPTEKRTADYLSGYFAGYIG